MTSMTREKVIQVPLNVAYKLIIKWVNEQELKIKKVDPNNFIIAKFVFRAGPIKTKKISFYLKQINQSSIQISTKVSMAGGLAFKGILNQVFRKSPLFDLIANLDNIDQRPRQNSSLRTVTERVNYTSQPFTPQSQLQNSPQQPNYQQSSYQQSISPQEREYNRLLEKKAMFVKIMQEAKETDLTFANEDKKEDVQRTIALYTLKIKEIDKKLEEYSK